MIRPHMDYIDYVIISDRISQLDKLQNKTIYQEFNNISKRNRGKTSMNYTSCIISKNCQCGKTEISIK